MDQTTALSLKTVKRFVHKQIKLEYSFKPKQGTEKPRYRCPFCGRMTHAERFLRLEIPNLDMDIMFYGGYRGIKVIKHNASPNMRQGMLGAMKEKLEWLFEKVGGEIEWLKSNSAWIQTVPGSFISTTPEPLRYQRRNVISVQTPGAHQSWKSGKRSQVVLTSSESVGLLKSSKKSKQVTMSPSESVTASPSDIRIEKKVRSDQSRGDS